MVERTRRKKSITNYKKRLVLLKSGIPRLIVRRTNKRVIVEVADYKPEGDKVLATVASNELSKFGWVPHCNIPSAYLTGFLIAKKMKALKFDGELILDIGLYKPIKNNVIFAAAKGCIDGGLNVRGNIEFDESRLKGEHIKEFVESDPSVKEKLTSYKNAKFNASDIDKIFETVKEKIGE